MNYLKNYIFYICLLFVFVISSCYNCKSLGEKSLGNKFALVEADKDDISIIYCTSKKCCTVGIPIVPSKVVDYSSNTKWIIAKSEAEGKITYWIIHKGFKVEFKYDSGMEKEILSHVTGPLDSANFYHELKQRNINLNF